MFAFAIYDIEKGALFAARDRLGIKPFYYAQTGNQFLFASEIKALLRSGVVAPRPDLVALHTPARYQISPATGYEGIVKLPPAHYLTFSAGRLEVRRYWHIRVVEDQRADLVDATARLDALLRESVQMQMIADVPVGVYLSGGVDSSLISALMARSNGPRIHS